MATTEATPIVDQIEEIYIPGDDEVATPQGGKGWRIAGGQIRRGPKEDTETREKIVGALLRYGLYFGTTSDGAKYGQFECDMKTSTGIEHVHVSITDKKTGETKPSVAAITFAEGLSEIGLGKVFVITANQSAKKNQYGEYSTYANLSHVDTNVRPPKVTPTKRGEKTDESLDVRWERVIAKLKTMPAYKEREQKADENAITHLSELCKECGVKGWPSPEQAPTEWLLLLSKAKKEDTPRASLADWTDDDWGTFRLALKDIVTCPPLLAEAKARLLAGVDTGAFG